MAPNGGRPVACNRRSTTTTPLRVANQSRPSDAFQAGYCRPTESVERSK